MQTEAETLERYPRDTIIELLVERDGDICMYPDCGQPLNHQAEGPMETSIDHWIPKSEGLRIGWGWAEIWDLDNLKLMHRKCNAKKGDRIPNEDGTLPDRKAKTFRYRRQKRAQRPEVCTACNAGRNLNENEVCRACGSGPKPLRAPRWKKMDIKDCDHAIFWCPGCAAGWIPRAGAMEMILLEEGE